MEKELTIVYVPIESIRPYENNPRRNEGAVDAVAESIRQCGYVSPIVVDENNEILAGHTRLAAVQSLGMQEVPVIVRKGLTEDQKRKYRILDNKTAELAGWDYTKLEIELEGLDFEGFDFGLDNMESLNIDELFAPAPDGEKEPKKIQCPHCGEWFTP